MTGEAVTWSRLNSAFSSASNRLVDFLGGSSSTASRLPSSGPNVVKEFEHPVSELELSRFKSALENSRGQVGSSIAKAILTRMSPDQRSKLLNDLESRSKSSKEESVSEKKKKSRKSSEFDDFIDDHASEQSKKKKKPKVLMEDSDDSPVMGTRGFSWQ